MINKLDFKTIEVSKDGVVGYLRLNRPETRNAFNLQMIEEIISATDYFNKQKEIKIVIISGNGAGFCSGFDLGNFSFQENPERIREIVALGRELSESVLRMRPITIARIHGHCIGGGVVLSAVCDFRYASEDAQFMLPETKIGIPLAWGGMPLLVRELGPLIAMEFTLLCKFISANKLLEMRWLNSVEPIDNLDNQIADTTASLTNLSHLVLELTKQQIYAARESMLGNNYSFADAHLLYAGLLDKESQVLRNNFLKSKASSKNDS